jgi:hypothetical protein
VVGISSALDSLFGLNDSVARLIASDFNSTTERDSPLERTVGLDPKSMDGKRLPTLFLTLVLLPPVPPDGGVGPTEQLSKFIWSSEVPSFSKILPPAFRRNLQLSPPKLQLVSFIISSDVPSLRRMLPPAFSKNKQFFPDN